MVTKCPGARRRWLNADGSSPKQPKKRRRKKVKKVHNRPKEQWRMYKQTTSL